MRRFTEYLAILCLPLSGAVLAADVSAADQCNGMDRQEAARSFYAYTLPLLEIGRRRAEFLQEHKANQWQHNRSLADHTAREVTTPNNDTIYSHAFLDLRNGPVTLSVPDTGKRYLSIALMDMYSNNFGYMGTRETGGAAAQLTLVAPGAPLPVGPGRAIHAPTPWVWALARTLVTSEQDLPAAAAVQDSLRIVGPASLGTVLDVPSRDSAVTERFVAARQLLAENPPLPADKAVMSCFAVAGLLGISAPTGVSMAEITRGFDAGRAKLSAARRPGRIANGWIYPQANHGNFGTDYGYRAAVAITGLGAMVQREATYLRSAPKTADNLFDGTKSYRLHFAANQLPPVDAFWSLSMYERTPDGGFYFVDNPLKRYAIGDRTPGLITNPDGSLDIWIGRDDPGPQRRANWLPAPGGPFALSLRAYLPRDSLLDGTWTAPPVERVR